VAALDAAAGQRRGAFAGRAGSSTAMVLGAVARRRPANRLLIVAHLDQADEIFHELSAQGLDVARFPALETLPGETSARSDLLGERLLLAESITAATHRVVVAPIAALMQPIPSPEDIAGLLRRIRPGDRIDLEEFRAWMVAAGWVRAATVERASEFAMRGDVVDIFPEVGPPIRLDVFGDEVESIHAIDLDTMGSAERLPQVDLVAGAAALDQGSDTSGPPQLTLGALLSKDWEVILDDVEEVRSQGHAYLDRVAGGGWIASVEDVQASLIERCGGITMLGAPHDAAELELPVSRTDDFPDQAAAAAESIAERSRGADIIVVCRTQGDLARMRELLGTLPRGVSLVEGELAGGFVWSGGTRPTHFVPYDEIVHRYQVRRVGHASSTRRDLDAFVEIAPGDYVVHREHGIARFEGVRKQSRSGEDDASVEEFLVLEFAQGARLLIPASGIDDVHRYIGAVKGAPDRSILGGKAWAGRKERAAESVRELAAELLRVQAVRQGRSGTACPTDGEWQHEFEAAFPWEETPDQRNAFDAVQQDMCAPRPMDRLVCGDVGFGKTEVAIRAAFRAALAGRQVAILVPTTVLAEQHERTFRSRFAGFPFRVESISRFKTGATQRGVLEDLASGAIDVLVGTHRILSDDIVFKDLGLVVIDEEQRFGVEHKQRLLQLRATVDVLTMTATPIPRTLHMSMMGLRDISSLQTAPVDRRAVVTEVMPWGEERLKAAIRRELAREGQVFVVHNRISDLDDIAEAIHALAPDARIVTGHGRMSAKELERTMLAFMRREADILVSTTIIESGIDIPNANTMIINEADRFGLAELHQLRGRVGRSRNRAYCYLLLPMQRQVNPDARRRLQAVESFSMLGAGFRIALRDLELRGAGNLLGPEQSGHIAAVGYELYCRLLEQAVADLREGKTPDQDLAVIDLGWCGYFPEAWIPGVARRLDAYRRLVGAVSPEAIKRVMEDLASAYGDVPPAATRMRWCQELAVAGMRLGAKSLLRRDDDIVITARQPEVLHAAMKHFPGRVRRVGQRGNDGSGEVWWRPPASWLALDVLADAIGRLASREEIAA